MGQIVDLSRMYIRNDDGDYDLETEIHQDVSLELLQNKELRNRPGNGFWDKRTGRQVGSIPNVAYLKALQEGYELESNDVQVQSRELKRYLNDHPEYRTVRNINTPGQSGNGVQLIIK